MASPGTLARTIVAGAFAGLLSATLSAAPLDCEKLKVSVLPEPPGYAAQCLGKSGAAPAAQAPNAPAAGNTYYLNLRSGGPFGQKVLSASNPSLNYVIVGPQTLPIFAMDFDNTATTLYGIDNASRNLGTISTTTGAFTPTTAVTGVTGDTISGMSFDPTSANVYISVTNGTPVTSASLYTLNIASGAAALVGSIVPTGNPPAIVDIAISNQGDLYAHDVGGDRILKIDKATAAVVEIGGTGFDANFAQGMDFDADTDTLWLGLYQGGGQQRLASVDLWNGTATILQSTGNEELEMAIKNVQPSAKAAPVAFQVFDPDLTQPVVAEMNETLTAHPVWRNIGTTPIPGGTGVVTAFAGAPGPTYNLHDANAAYAEMPPGGAITTGDGYEFSIDGTTRPEPHFDASMLEFLPHANAFKSWTFHVGGSFTDVSPSSGFYPFIEETLHLGVTAGCGPGIFCPTSPVPREQMAVFVLASKMGIGYVPPPCSPPNTFADVSETSPYCPFIEEVERRQIVVGCGGGNYCPTLPTTRAQMPVFLLRTQYGRDFAPPPCGAPVFADVAAGNPFCPYVEEAHRREITAGCATNPLRYCPDDFISREELMVMAVQTFFRLRRGRIPTPGPTATVTPPSMSGSLSREGPSAGSPGSNDAVGLAFLLIGFASAVGLPIALGKSPKAAGAAKAD